jgi:hypothetical protein
MTRLSITWKNGSKAMVTTISMERKKGNSLLDDLRLAFSYHPIGGKIYWRDDIFDGEIFHAHWAIRNPFDALGESIAQAHLVK